MQTVTSISLKYTRLNDRCVNFICFQRMTTRGSINRVSVHWSLVSLRSLLTSSRLLIGFQCPQTDSDHSTGNLFVNKKKWPAGALSTTAENGLSSMMLKIAKSSHLWSSLSALEFVDRFELSCLSCFTLVNMTFCDKLTKMLWLHRSFDRTIFRMLITYNNLDGDL